jgi:hypothetical protein
LLAIEKTGLVQIDFDKLENVDLTAESLLFKRFEVQFKFDAVLFMRHVKDLTRLVRV